MKTHTHTHISIDLYHIVHVQLSIQPDANECIILKTDIKEIV